MMMMLVGQVKNEDAKDQTLKSKKTQYPTNLTLPQRE
jgi:hypothetical protein